jgi:signal transduction histidine kinase
VRRLGVTGAVVAAVAVVTAVAAATLAPTLERTAGLAVGLHAGTAIYAASVGAFVWARSRDAQDPHALFVATGLGLIAAQSAVVSVWEVFAPPRITGSIAGFAIATGGPGGSIAPHLWLAGWALAGACFLLAVPPWDRRGRPAVRPGRVVGGAAAALAATDLIVVLAQPDLSTRTYSAIVTEGWPRMGALGIGSWGLLVAGVAALGAASVRETLLARKVASSTHPWLASAWALAALLVIAVFLRPTEGLDVVQWADVLQPAIVALVFAGFLSAHRDDASRMRRASDRAEAIIGGRAEIASMVAHEVRGPIATIKGLAATTLMSHDKLSDAERREFLGLIDQESSRLMTVVDQISLALKIDAGTITFDRRHQPLEPIVQDSVTRADTGDRVVEVDADDGIAAVVDRRWFGEAIRQVIDNAAKFSPTGTRILVRMRSDDGVTAVEVIDQGPGVPSERRNEVFSKFTTWRPPGYEDRPGSGLGLFICQGLLRELEGDASFADRSDGGTMLRIRLRTEG